MVLRLSVNNVYNHAKLAAVAAVAVFNARLLLSTACEGVGWCLGAEAHTAGATPCAAHMQH
eukprot:816740-Pelagomonas_calceolata.AAC.1